MTHHRAIRSAPVRFGCRDCGNTLVSVTSSAGTSVPYPSTFLSCPHCGARWDLDDTGIPGLRR